MGCQEYRSSTDYTRNSITYVGDTSTTFYSKSGFIREMTLPMCSVCGNKHMEAKPLYFGYEVYTHHILTRNAQHVGSASLYNPLWLECAKCKNQLTRYIAVVTTNILDYAEMIKKYNKGRDSDFVFYHYRPHDESAEIEWDYFLELFNKYVKKGGAKNNGTKNSVYPEGKPREAKRSRE